jgi:hypothetical protein
MMQAICPYETAVARAVRIGLWSEVLREHTSTCAICQEVIGVTRLLQPLVAESNEGCNAASLWRRALLERKQAEADRAHRPIQIAQGAALVVTGVAVLRVGASLTPSMTSGSIRLSPEMLLSPGAVVLTVAVVAVLLVIDAPSWLRD